MSAWASRRTTTPATAAVFLPILIIAQRNGLRPRPGRNAAGSQGLLLVGVDSKRGRMCLQEFLVLYIMFEAGGTVKWKMIYGTYAVGCAACASLPCCCCSDSISSALSKENTYHEVHHHSCSERRRWVKRSANACTRAPIDISHACRFSPK